MNDDERLDEYLKLCARIYDRMRRENSFPWRDSTEPEDMIDSDDSPK